MAHPFLMAAALLVGSGGTAAESAAPAPRVFVDCVGFTCDETFFHTEITFVTYVRDRKDADVHAQISLRYTGGAGTEYTLRFLGLREFAGDEQSLRYIARAGASAGETRAGMARTLAIGLLRFVAGTPIADRIRIEYSPLPGDRPADRNDPWDFWLFQSSLRGSFLGQKTTRYSSISGSFYAYRTTEQWKSYWGAYQTYTQQDFEFDDGSKLTSISRSNGASGMLSRGLGNHFSAAAWTSLSTSTYVNRKLESRISPGVEWSLFPYSEATRRRLTLVYNASVRHTDYEEETLYDKRYETLFDEALTLEVEATQPWGTIRSSLRGSHYFHDLTKNQVLLDTTLRLRLVKGLALELTATGALVHDQIYLPKAGATPEEILLQKRQLATDYTYNATVGFSYTFGSIYNDVVNPRFN